RQNITTQRFAELNRQFTDAQSERMKKEAVFDFAKSGNLDAGPQLRQNGTLQEILKRKADTYSQYTDGLNQYGPNFPKVQRLQTHLKDLDAQIETEKHNILTDLENDYNGARQRENVVGDALNAQKAEVNTMAQSMVEYNILKRIAEADKTMY